MVILNNILYLSFADLIEFGFSEEYLSKKCSQYRSGEISSYANIPNPKDARVKLVQYTSIPARAITEKNIPSEAQLRAQHADQNIEDAVKEFAGLRLDMALNYFKANPNTYQHAQELAQQSVWLLFLAAVKPTQAKALGCGSVEELHIKAIELINRKGWTRWKVESLQRFTRKIKPFRALYKKPLNGNYTVDDLHQALDTLVHKGYGNKNREKLGEEQQALIFQLYSNGSVKPTIDQVYMIYLQKAGEMIAAGKWTTDALVGISTVKAFLYRDDIRQAYWKPRFGTQQYRSNYEMITKRKRATFANALWIIDGTPAHQYYMDGNYAYARINVFVVLDAHSWCVLGFYIDENETHQQVKGALRAAATLTGGLLPYQIQSDNGSAISGYFGRTCIETIAPYFTPAQPGNARSKAVESFFKHFNQSVARFYPGFTHSPVMANNINNKPNPDALQQQIKDKTIPTKEEAVKQLHEMFTVWNHKPFNGVKSPLEKYRESLSETTHLQRKLTQEILIDAFYEMPGKLKQVKGLDADGKMKTIQSFVPTEYPYTNEGIEIILDKRTYTFKTDDPDFNARFIGKRFCVKYDPQDPSQQIYLYENTREGARPFIFDNQHACLKSPFLFAQALVDRTDGEAKKLSDHLQSKKAQRSLAEEKAQRFIDITKENGTFTPLTPGNAFDKKVLTAAKQALTEKIINGNDYRITDENTTPVLVPQRSYGRWDDAAE